MIVFDNWKFREILKSIVDKKELNGDRIYSKQGLSVDHNQITVDRLYATTLAENTPTVELLKKIGFHGDNPEDGPILVMQGFLDEDKEINICSVIKMIYEEKSMCT